MYKILVRTKFASALGIYRLGAGVNFSGEHEAHSHTHSHTYTSSSEQKVRNGRRKSVRKANIVFGVPRAAYKVASRVSHFGVGHFVGILLGDGRYGDVSHKMQWSQRAFHDVFNGGEFLLIFLSRHHRVRTVKRSSVCQLKWMVFYCMMLLSLLIIHSPPFSFCCVSVCAEHAADGILHCDDWAYFLIFHSHVRAHILHVTIHNLQLRLCRRHDRWIARLGRTVYASPTKRKQEKKNVLIFGYFRLIFDFDFLPFGIFHTRNVPSSQRSHRRSVRAIVHIHTQTVRQCNRRWKWNQFIFNSSRRVRAEPAIYRVRWCVMWVCVWGVEIRGRARGRIANSQSSKRLYHQLEIEEHIHSNEETPHNISYGNGHLKGHTVALGRLCQQWNSTRRSNIPSLNAKIRRKVLEWPDTGVDNANIDGKCLHSPHISIFHVRGFEILRCEIRDARNDWKWHTLRGSTWDKCCAIVWNEEMHTTNTISFDYVDDADDIHALSTGNRSVVQFTFGLIENKGEPRFAQQ